MGVRWPLLFLHISSSWVKIRLHTKNQLPRLPGRALKVSLGLSGASTAYMVVQLITLSLSTWVEAVTILFSNTDISKYIWCWLWWWGWGGGLGDPNFFLHISSSWVKIMLYNENQLPRLPGRALKVSLGLSGVSTAYMVEFPQLIWVVVQLITLSLSTWVKVELRLWQFYFECHKLAGFLNILSMGIPISVNNNQSANQSLTFT